MPDSPDYSKYGIQSVRFSLQDMGELAVRMGSPDWYDRLGNVMFMDAFGYGIAPYVTATNGVGSSVSIVASSESASGYACKLVTGAVPAPSAILFKYLTALQRSKHGLEVSFSIGSAFVDMVFSFAYLQGTEVDQAAIKLVSAGGLLQYLNSAGAYATFATGLTISSNPAIFHHIKLVVDWDAKAYLHFLYDGILYDLSAFGVQIAAGGATFQERAVITLDGNAGGAYNAIIGSVLMTSDEPK